MTGLLARLTRLSPEKLAALASLAVRIAAAGLAAVLQVVLARVLGAGDYGIFAWAWALVTIGGYATTFGFSQIAVRFLASYAERGEAAAARGFLHVARWSVIAGSTILAGLAALVLVTTGPWVEPVRVLPLLIVLATVPFFALGDLAEGFARSQGWNILALAPGYILRQLVLIALLPLVWLFGFAADATSGLAAAFIATAVTALGQMAFVLRRLHPLFAAGKRDTGERRQWLAAAGPVFLADAVQVLRQNVDVLILAAFVPAAEVAVYFAATRVASLLGLVEFAVGAAAAHRFARIDDKAEPAALAAVARESAILTFWPTLAAALALWLVAPVVLALFGDAYRSADELVFILALGAVLRAVIGPADDFLTMRGHGGLNLLAQVAGLAATVLVALICIPPLGAAGAAFAVLMGAAANTLALAIGSGRRTGIVPLPLPAFAFSRRQPA